MLYKGTTQSIPGEVKLVTATIAASGTTVTNTADTDLVGGKIIGVYATSTNNTDAHVKTTTLSATGAVTLTLSSASTAEAVYTVAIARASGNDS